MKNMEFLMISGVFGVGKPQNEMYYQEYNDILLKEIKNKQLPILCNINIGHATPRCAIPFGVYAKVDVNSQTIQFE